MQQNLMFTFVGKALGILSTIKWEDKQRDRGGNDPCGKRLELET